MKSLFEINVGQNLNNSSKLRIMKTHFFEESRVNTNLFSMDT